MKGNNSIYLWRALVIPLFLLILEVLVRAKVINPFFVAEPSNFLAALVRELAGGELLKLTAKTMSEVGIVFAIGSTIGISVGYVLWKVPVAGTAYETFLGAVMASPVVLLYPIFLIFFGRTMWAIIALNAVHSTIPIILNTRHGLMDVSPSLIKVGRSLNLSDRQIFRHILLPAAVPMIFSGLRLGIIYMLLGIIALEYIVSMGGLGWFISDKAFRFEAPELYAAISLVLLLSVAVMYLMGRAQKAMR